MEDTLRIFTDGGGGSRDGGGDTNGSEDSDGGLMRNQRTIFEGPSNPLIELLIEDMEPQPRNRCNSWPLRRQVVDSPERSPLIHQLIPEDDEPGACGSGTLTTLESQTKDGQDDGYSPWTTDMSPPMAELSSPNGGTSPVNKKGTTRRNAWGNMSYADLITQAIMSCPEKRLTLSQIYDWMVQNVPYFRDKGDNNSSAGWKNSIRHNLSLHQRFMRIQNEGAGKSSWWVINPDAKPGKASRRRAQTMEVGAAKAHLEKKRGRVRKRVEQLKAGGASSSNCSLTVSNDGPSLLMPNANDDNSPDYLEAFGIDQFRARSDSNISNYSTPGGVLNCGGSHHSPGFDELDVYWGINPNVSHTVSGDPLIPADVLNMTGNMRLAGAPIKSEILDVPGNSSPLTGSSGCLMSPQGSSSPFPNSVINYQTSPIKTEIQQQPSPAPPAYQQLYPNTSERVSPLFQQAVHHSQQQSFSPIQLGGNGGGGGVYNQTQVLLNGGYYQHTTAGQQQQNSCGFNGAYGNRMLPTAPVVSLPQDLTSIEINSPIQCNMDEVLKHEFEFSMGALDFNNKDSVPNFTN